MDNSTTINFTTATITFNAATTLNSASTHTLNFTIVTTLNSTTISNSTSTPSTITCGFRPETDWIISVTVNIVFTLCLLWLIASLVHYGVKSGKWKKVHGNHSDKLSSGLVYSSVLFCAVTCLIYFIFTLVHLNIGFQPGQNHLCDAINDVTSYLYGFLLFNAAVFLWLRQRSFFTNQMLNVSYSKPVRIFSFASVIIIFSTYAIVTTANILPNNSSSCRGCTLMSDDKHDIGLLLAISLAELFSQGTLLGLLAYALRKGSSESRKVFKKQKQPQNRSDNHEPYDCENASANRNYGKATSHSSRSSASMIKTILRKSLIFAIASLFTDVILHVVLFFVDPHIRIVHAMFTVSGFLNVCYVVLSFVQWKEILLSFINQTRHK